MKALARAKYEVHPPHNDNSVGAVELAPIPAPRLHRGSCFDVFATIPDHSVALALCDLPYGVTRLAWDSKIDLAAFWEEMRRIVTPNGAVVAFGTQPFTSQLVVSNPDWFKYACVWKKSRPTGFQHCKQRILLEHEDVLIFSPGTIVGAHRSSRNMTYNPQGLVEMSKPRVRKPDQRRSMFDGKSFTVGAVQTHTNFPRSVLEFGSVAKPDHPTQKPVDLLAYLIRTFSDPGDVVLDPTMGVGSTGVAAVQEGREFIGVELDPDFYMKAFNRIFPDTVKSA